MYVIYFLQVKETNLEPTLVEDSIKQEAVVVENAVHSLTSQINELAVSGDSSIVTPTNNSVEASEPIGSAQDLDKKIRALKKKVLVLCFGFSAFPLKHGCDIYYISVHWFGVFDEVNSYKYERLFVMYV